MSDTDYCPDCRFPVETLCHCSTREWPQLSELRAALTKEKGRAKEFEEKWYASNRNLHDVWKERDALRAQLDPLRHAADELEMCRATLAEREAQLADTRARLELYRGVEDTLGDCRAALREREAEMERLSRAFECCGGNDENPTDHTTDCHFIEARAALAAARKEALDEGAAFADQMAENWARVAAEFATAKRNPAEIANCRGVMEGSMTIAAKLRALASNAGRGE